MRCDRCGRDIEGEAMVGLGPRRPFRNLCKTCWTVETRSSNSRLISALNEMTRQIEGERGGEPKREKAARRGRRGLAARGAGSDGAEWGNVVERRDDPSRPRWHP